MQFPAHANRSAALAVPIAEEATAGGAPDNLVDFLRFRDSNRPPTEIHPVDTSAPRVPMEPPGNTPSRLVEETFRWNGIPHSGQTTVLSAARDTLLLTVLWTAVAFLGFHLFRALLLWGIG